MLRTDTHGPVTRIEMARTIMGRPVFTVSAYMLGDTLVDSGCAAAAAELVDWSRTHGVRRAVHTHYHEDHTGGDARLIAELGVEVFATPETAAQLRAFYRLPLYRLLTWGQPGNVEASPIGGEVMVGGHPFRVIPTPGHCPDHVCLYQPENGWLFSGDLFISARAKYLRRGEDAWRILSSLRRVRGLEPRTMMCSHSGFIANPEAAITAKVRYWEDLAEKGAALRRRGESDREITRRLLGREGFLSWFSAGDFSKLNLMRSLLREPVRTGAVQVSHAAARG